jgi:hypothetical protein
LLEFWKEGTMAEERVFLVLGLWCGGKEEYDIPSKSGSSFSVTALAIFGSFPKRTTGITGAFMLAMVCETGV